VIELAAAAAKSTSAWDEPGTLAFLVIFGMGVILYFVFRSLARQLRKINEAARLEALQADSLQADSLQDQALQDNGSPAHGSLGQVVPPAS
jgi:hypothetical protein